MATSSMSSLGLGSDGVLSYDVIDQLRKADEAAQITPIDNKLTTNSTKQTDLKTLTTLTATLKSATSTLSDEMSYLKRTTTVSDSAVSVTSSSGVNIQDFTLRVDQLAQKDIYQTKGYASSSTALGLSAGTFKFSINSKEYSVNVTSSTTLDSLKESINEAAGDKVTASILNVGGTDPYKLIIKSDETGSDNAITFTAGTTTTALGLADTANHLQTAKNASFVYNGVTVTRSSNTIEDLIVGATITLNSKHDVDESSTISIKQDTTDMKDGIESLVSSYNELIANLNEALTYDSDTETAGTFQGVSQISSLSSDIRRQLLVINSSGKSLIDYGISLNDNGYLEFDETVFDEKMTSDASDVETFFRGETDEDGNTTNGFFTNFNELLAGYVGDDGILSLYSTSLTSEKTSLTKERESTVARLDDRYETMAARFASYDSIISKLNNQFSALSMMIEQAYSS